MNEDLKEPWIEALRSGKYKQGTGQLSANLYDSDDNQVGVEYCCLGVLCETNGWSFDGDDAGIVAGPVELIGTYEYRNVFDSNEVPGLSGLSFVQRTRLADLNDVEEWTFAEIADWVEKHL